MSNLLTVNGIDLKPAEAQIPTSMANQMPSDIKQFRVSITSLFICIIVACFIGIIWPYLLILIRDGHVDLFRFFRAVKVVMPLLLLVCIIAPLIIYFLEKPAGFSIEGIYARSRFGFRRFIRWTDIAKVRRFPFLNLKYLWIYSSVDGKVTSLPLFQAHKKAFNDEIRKFAPPDSPIHKFLN